MRLTNLSVSNFQGVKSAELPLPTAIGFITGDNYAGKSTIAEAVRMALLGSAERVSLKKELGQVVRDGAKLGSAAVEVDGAPVAIALPSGKRSGEEAVPASPALPYVLSPELFAAAKPDDRRQLLFTLTGTRATPDEIERRLLERGCHKMLVAQMKPILRGGFAAGAEFAKKQATEAKGAWRGVTNETWGSQKGETWQAEVPAYDQAGLDAAQTELAAIEVRMEAAAKAVGALEQQLRAYQGQKDQLAAIQERAGRLDSLRAKLQCDQQDLDTWTAKVQELQAKAGTGPRQGLVHDLARCLAEAYEASSFSAEMGEQIDCVLDAYEAQYGKLDATGDPEAAAALPKAIEARDLSARAAENCRRDIAAAEAAAEDLKSRAVPEAVADEDVAAARAHLAGLRNERAEAYAEVDALLAAKQASVGAAQRTRNAAEYHAEVMAWDAIGSALSPDGIPGEILAKALQPFNDELVAMSDCAGWPLVQIDGDMAITAGGRAYRLLSESEKWRADALLALAIAHLSGLRCAILDRFDCLNLAGRSEILGLLDALAADGDIDTVLLLGTLKAAPAAPSEAFTVYWIEQGRAGAAQLKEAA
ncbi:AAA family ATPase [Bordetella petrii]|uniref:RecF protein n=1 Tax=Bordetella petrii (strain ATCC BAA-461 / DSM 12804 / CCUG 43448 / CIP 107267 / Se-1111R) TaxID=340100 RepID=A9I8S3_BORPD|nr:AAA family ATPase [Bordetella petrii]CAP41282.1 RecF protein [Bordetella petrii]